MTYDNTIKINTKVAFIYKFKHNKLLKSPQYGAAFLLIANSHYRKKNSTFVKFKQHFEKLIRIQFLKTSNTET